MKHEEFEDYQLDEVLEARLRQFVATTRPRCLGGFQCTPVPSDEEDRVAWSLACRCGSRVGEALGHPFDKYGEGRSVFVSPLSFRCSACGLVTEIIDTKRHGYDSEMDAREGEKSGDVNVRGTGEPTVVRCAECGDSEFSLTAYCIYSHFDYIEWEPDLEPHAHDYFDGFDLHGRCAPCGHAGSLAVFGSARDRR